MSDKIKPCPYCNGKANLWIEDACFYYVCTDCNMRGPDIFVEKANAAEQVAEAWNALPRRPHWTTKPPTKPGWYWQRRGKEDTPLPVRVEKGSSLLAGNQWAGPIPEPHQN